MIPSVLASRFRDSLMKIHMRISHRISNEVIGDGKNIVRS